MREESNQHSELVAAIQAGIDWPADAGEGEYHTVMEAAEDALDSLVEQLETLREAASRKSFRREGLPNSRSLSDLAALDAVLASNPASEPEEA